MSQFDASDFDVIDQKIRTYGDFDNWPVTCDRCKQTYSHKQVRAVDQISASKYQHVCLSCWPQFLEESKRICAICNQQFLPLRNTEICENCYKANRKQWIQFKQLQEKVYASNLRAKKAKTKGVLTLRQWVATLKHFNYTCAYCKKQSWEIIEHYIPLKLGGNTSVQNCVPACEKCNLRKNKYHPDHIFYFGTTIKKEVEEFLYGTVAE